MRILFLVLAFLALPQLAHAGAQTYSTPGTYSFVVPSYGALTVTVWGAGGGGGGAGGAGSTVATDGSGGGYSYFSSVIAYGGAGGPRSIGNGYTASAAGGSASGGDTNIAGNPGGAGQGRGCLCGGAGGSAPYGGAGGASSPSYVGNGGAGGAPGGGGGGAEALWGSHIFHAAGGGGSGGYAQKVYSAGQLAVGQSITVVVGGGGAPGTLSPGSTGGWGANGSVTITWTAPAAPTCSINASPTTINRGSNSALSWTSTNSTTFYISNIGYVTANTSSGTNVTPSSTITYSGTATGPGGTANCSRTVTVNQSCTFNGSPVTHGSSVTAYQAATVPYGNSCVSQTRTCTNGTLSGTYTNASCSVTPAANCTVNGTTVLHGASQTFYTSQTAPAGGTCSAISQSRTCTNGTLSGTATYQYGSCSCAPTYSCSANNVRYTNSSCVTSTVATCTAPSYCSAGQSACVNPDPEYTPTGDLSGHLEVRPALVRAGSSTKVYWNVDNVTSCSVMGTNGDSWTGASSGASGRTSSPIDTRTTFTLTCIALSGVTPSPISESVDALIIPVFQEQ